MTGGFPEPAADGSYGVVIDRHAMESPWNFLKIGSTKFDVFVGVVPPSGCVPSGGKLEPAGACAGVAASGMVSGAGTTSTGVEFLIVTVRVSEQCHAALKPGDHWPSSHTACQK